MSELTVLGEALWDLYPAGSDGRLRTRRNELRCPGGAPANVARTLARLGIDVAMIGAVGDDALGDGLRDELAAAGVETASIVTVRARTGLVFVELVDGTPRFLPFRSPSADMLLPASAIPDHRVPWLHLGSSSLVGATREAAELAIERADKVSIDLNIYPFLFANAAGALDDVIARATVVKASDRDLQALGLSRDRSGARALHARRAHGVTIATFGVEGAIAFVGGELLERAAEPSTVVDEAGAGDAFIAGVLASLLRHRSLGDALALGARLGARAVTAIGATTSLSDLTSERAALSSLR